MDNNTSKVQISPKSITDYLKMCISSTAQNEGKDFTVIADEFNTLIKSLGIKYESSTPIATEDALVWYIDTLKKQLKILKTSKETEATRLGKILSLKLE